MTDVAIVGSKRDAQFAEAVRDGALAAGKHDVSISESLPGSRPDSFVVLIWSAALESGHAIDVQALVGLWSEGRLLVVRRDDTALPLGLRDLRSLQPDSTPADACAAIDQATQDDAPRFMRRESRVLYSKPEEQKPSSQGAFSRGQSPYLPNPEVKKKSAPGLKLFAALVFAGIAFGGWHYFTAAERARVSALTAALEEATKATQQLQQAKHAELEARVRVSEAGAAEDAARKSGDTAALKAATDLKLKAEAEAAAQGRLVRQRELEVQARVDAAKKANDDARKSAEPTKKSAMVAKAEAPKPAPAASAPRAMTRSEREAQRDAEAAAKALGKPAEQVAAITPSDTVPSAAEPAAKGVSDAESMYQQALEMENSGKAADAVRIYRRAARAGHGKSAKRLGDIFDRGVPGVSRDYAESLQWYQTARDLGETVETANSRREYAESIRPEIVIVAIVILALGVVLWRRTRRAPVPAAPQSEATGRSGVQAPAEAAALFVSYSHKDKKRVEPIVSLIEGMGRRVWIDRTDITGQAGWAGQIVRAIRECRAVVLMASPNSYGSDQVVRELYLAMNHKKPIVPIEIEPADLPDELQYILAPFQHHRLSGRETRDVLGRALAAV